MPRRSRRDPAAPLFPRPNAHTPKDTIAMNLLKTFLAEEDGPTAVEYAVMLALIIVVCIAAITTLGSNANNTFSSVATKAAPAGAAS